MPIVKATEPEADLYHEPQVWQSISEGYKSVSQEMTALAIGS